jgi:hypothetical protein
MIGDFMLWLEETGSTQNILKEFSFPYGTVVVANRQRKAGEGLEEGGTRKRVGFILAFF